MDSFDCMGKIVNGMEEWMKENLDRNLEELSRSLPLRHVLLHLQAANIFDHNDSELLMNDSVYQSEAEKRIKIVDELKTRGCRAYWLFCHYIKERCLHIYFSLHDDVINEENICSVCNGEEESQQCNYCKGTYFFVMVCLMA